MAQACQVDRASEPRAHRKVLVVITEDWFALSHFVPLLSELVTRSDDVLVTTRSSGRLQEIEAFGVRSRHADFGRGSLNPVRLARACGSLARLIEQERPHVVHAIAMQTMVITSLALARCKHRPGAVVLHLTGTGYIGQSRSPIAALLRPLARASLGRCMSTQDTWLLAENHDDLAELAAMGPMLPGRTELIAGAGIDPAAHAVLPPPASEVPRVAFVGRMLVSKGVHVLVEAHRRLRENGMHVDVALYGDADNASRQAIQRTTLDAWNALPGIRWHGTTNDVARVWAESDIAVVPGLGGDGMPRTMLEAAACGRPLIVTDVPGCRQFVRNGVEGFVVPPNDAYALAEAIARLAGDSQLRTRMGAAARERVLAGYTTDSVRAAYRRVYARLAGPGALDPAKASAPQ